MKFILVLKNKKTDEEVHSKPGSLWLVLSASRYAIQKHLWFRIRRYRSKKSN